VDREGSGSDFNRLGSGSSRPNNYGSGTHCYEPYLWVPGMAILAIVSTITVDGIAPLVGRLHVGAGRRPVLELLRASPPVLVVVELGAGVPLPSTQIPNE